MTAKKKRNTEEASLQRAVVQHLIFRGVPGLIFFAVPNGMVSDPVSVARMKAQGLMPGAPDLMIFVPPDEPFDDTKWPYPLCLELKSAKGRLSEAQAQFEVDCNRIRLAYEVAFNIDEALEILEFYGALRADANTKIARAA